MNWRMNRMATINKIRIHNEYFQPLVKATCPCGQKKTQVFAWGEYSRGRWFTVDHFCQQCFSRRVIPRLLNHAGDCGCKFHLQARTGYSIPSWINEEFVNKLEVCHVRG